jgi:hypothetical protein
MYAPKGRHATAQGNALGPLPKNVFSHEGAEQWLIPHIAFIKLDAVFVQQTAVFFLKCNLAGSLSRRPDARGFGRAIAAYGYALSGLLNVFGNGPRALPWAFT